MAGFNKGYMTGWVAVVTGVTSGIGRNVAYRLCSLGMKVVGVGRNSQKLESLESSVRTAAEGELYVYTCDMSVETDVIKLFQFVKEKFKKMEILVNTAGDGRITRPSDCEAEKWRRMFEMNVISVGVATREALKIMEASDTYDGFIINIGGTSGRGLSTVLEKYVFDASKLALGIITKGIRMELEEKKSKVKILMISTGCVDTKLSKQQGWREKFEEDALTPSLLPDEVSDTIVFLLEASRKVQVPEIYIRPLGEAL